LREAPDTAGITFEAFLPRSVALYGNYTLFAVFSYKTTLRAHTVNLSQKILTF